MRTALAFLSLCGVLSAQGLTEGHSGSKVRAVIYEDLQCPDCAAFRVMLDQRILPKYGDRVEFIHRDFPLAKHAWARQAAIAARFFTGKDAKLGLEYRRHTMATRAETRPDNFNSRLAAFATEHGIDPEEAVAALGNAKYAEAVEKDYQDGVARGVVHTPTVLVNGAPFIETFTFEEIAKGIEAALAQAQ
ncbi:MAG TPA: thioredoxin domain-containing protein [Bryobacteraceae bacterium]|nr:thioredoxin domain-containing protein [Bryobacteraceae bacterium]